jgi:hypothetical protein
MRDATQLPLPVTADFDGTIDIDLDLALDLDALSRVSGGAVSIGSVLGNVAIVDRALPLRLPAGPLTPPGGFGR